MRFIGVLAMIAGFGFAISAVQFIRIGVRQQKHIAQKSSLMNGIS
jgi:hypothetical protein